MVLSLVQLACSGYNIIQLDFPHLSLSLGTIQNATLINVNFHFKQPTLLNLFNIANIFGSSIHVELLLSSQYTYLCIIPYIR